MTLEQRLWKRVSKGDGCWEWHGARDAFGYGVIGRGGRGAGNVQTHRAAWELTNGPVPEGRCVLHTCDNPPCVRLDHLWVGTRADNNRDMAQKGRHVGLRRVTWDDVRAIRASAENVRVLAARFGISHWTVYSIRSGRTWLEGDAKQIVGKPVEALEGVAA